MKKLCLSAFLEGYDTKSELIENPIPHFEKWCESHIKEKSVEWTYQQENKLWELHINGEYCGLFDSWDKSKVIKIISLLQD